MTPATILILGGYGQAGHAIASRILQHTDCRLVLAGRSLEKAECAAHALAAPHGEGRVSTAVMDAAEPGTLAMHGIDLAIISAFTVPYTPAIARAAIEQKVDYLDLQYSRAKLNVLNSLVDRIKDHGCCFITDGGAYPGIPAMLVRFLAKGLTAIERAFVYTRVKTDWAKADVGIGAYEEMIAGMVDQGPTVYQQDRWRETTLRDLVSPVRIDFGPVFGAQFCVPRWLGEMHWLPAQYPTLQQCSASLASPRRIAHWLPKLAQLGATRSDRSMNIAAQILARALRRFSTPPFGMVIKAEVSGSVSQIKKTLMLSADNSYALTASAVVATLRQHLDGSIARPGLWLQAHIVDPARMLRDMENMGIEVIPPACVDD